MVTKQPVIGVVTYSGRPARASRADQSAHERVDVPEQPTEAQSTSSVATVS